jgi:fluoroquinolone transport system permease protein
MVARALTLAAHDIRLQWRYGIYLAYGFVLAFYVGILVGTGSYLPDWVPAVIIFTDPAAVGFFFLGALMMLERAERVANALAVAPVALADYFIGKCVTLTGVALIAGAVLLLFVYRPSNPALLISAVALISMQYLGIGVPIALRFETVSAYLLGSAGFLTPVIAPGALALIPGLPLPFLLVPAAAQLRLMLVATGAISASSGEIAFCLLVSLAAAAGAVWLALRALKREFGR